MTKKNIVAGFRRSGLWPPNRHVITPEQLGLVQLVINVSSSMVRITCCIVNCFACVSYCYRTGENEKCM